MPPKLVPAERPDGECRIPLKVFQEGIRPQAQIRAAPTRCVDAPAAKAMVIPRTSLDRFVAEPRYVDEEPSVSAVHLWRFCCRRELAALWDRVLKGHDESLGR